MEPELAICKVKWVQLSCSISPAHNPKIFSNSSHRLCHETKADMTILRLYPVLWWSSQAQRQWVLGQPCNTGDQTWGCSMQSMSSWPLSYVPSNRYKIINVLSLYLWRQLCKYKNSNHYVWWNTAQLNRYYIKLQGQYSQQNLHKMGKKQKYSRRDSTLLVADTGLIQIPNIVLWACHEISLST